VPAMPFPEGISEVQERILQGLWKLKGIGNNPIEEETLRKGLTAEPHQGNWTNQVESLHKQGFLLAASKDGRNCLALTPLGVAILRKIEEDRLQELE